MILAFLVEENRQIDIFISNQNLTPGLHVAES
jgi:hypothetical protein